MINVSIIFLKEWNHSRIGLLIGAVSTVTSNLNHNNDQDRGCD